MKKKKELQFAVLAECPNCGCLVSSSDIHRKECDACGEEFIIPKIVPVLKYEKDNKAIEGFNWDTVTTSLC